MTMSPTGQATLEELLGTVKDAMTVKVVMVPADLPAEVALRRLERTWVSGAPVVEGGRVVGVVTLRDLLTPLAPYTATGSPFLRQDQHLADIRVRDLMSPEPIVARVDWPLSRAVARMAKDGVNRLPVLDEDDKPVGIITRDDVLRVVNRLLEAKPAENPPDSEG